MNTIDKDGLEYHLYNLIFTEWDRIGVGSFGFFLHNRGCGFNQTQNTQII